MKKLILFSMFCACATVMNAQPQIWHVAPPDDNGDPTGSGVSWNNPCSITYAIQTAVDGDEIWVKQGTYQVNLVIMKKLKIYGGFNGTESSLSDRMLTSVGDYSVLQPKHIDSLSIVNVNPNPFAFTIPDSCLWPNRVCHLDSFLLDGFTLKKGDFQSVSGGPKQGWGGAIMSDSVYHIILKNLWIDSNSAFLGGGIYIQNSAHGWMENLLFTRNYAQSLGGGMFLTKSFDFTLINMAFTFNYASCSNEVYSNTQISGGFYLEEGDFTIHNMTVAGNIGEEGGTINKSTVWFYNTIIWPDHIHVYYNHDNIVYFNNCCLYTTNQQELQGWNPIPFMGNWSNIIWDYDSHNIIVTDNIYSIDPLFNWTPLIPPLLYVPELSPNSQFKDAAGQYESLYPGDIFDVLRSNRFDDILDWGAFECQNNNSK